MRYLLIFFVFIFLVMANATTSRGSDEKNTTETPRVYPIAPGVWYPGEPLPETPIRYYRVRCWPGCHRGSSHGKYPNEPLNMEPIFPTGTIDLWPPAATDTK